MLQNDIALVTGASRGIGQGIARALSAAGARVIVKLRANSALVTAKAANERLALVQRADALGRRTGLAGLNMPEISVPKGGGALTGIGETFQPDPHMGTGTLTVPLPLPHARATPSLALSYTSATGNGPFGLGWSRRARAG